MEMMLDKKQIIAIFKFDFKMGHKVMETTLNINNPLGPGTTNEYTREKKKLSEFNGAAENGVSSIVPISVI